MSFVFGVIWCSLMLFIVTITFMIILHDHFYSSRIDLHTVTLCQ